MASYPMEIEGIGAAIPRFVDFQMALEIGPGELAPRFPGPGKLQGTRRDSVLPK